MKAGLEDRLRIEILPLFIVVAVCVLSWGGPAVFATVDDACETGESCRYCHEDPYGGGTLTAAGEAYRNAGYRLDGEAQPPIWFVPVRLAAGLLHLLGAVVWFGTIFYVHLFVKPASLSGGLPKGERVLGWVCIGVVALTGAVLTAYRVHAWKDFVGTTFGLVWLVKVGLFLIMVGVAALATTRLNRRMREARENRVEGQGPLADGKEGRPAHIVYEGRTYDVSNSGLWRGGVHMGRHHAGADLTDAMAGAPHGAEVLEKVADRGPAQDGARLRVPAVRMFVFLAYFVLFVMLGILFCVSYWSWGPPLVG